MAGEDETLPLYLVAGVIFVGAVALMARIRERRRARMARDDGGRDDGKSSRPGSR